MEKSFEIRVGEVLKLLADPTRRKIIQMITTKPMNPKDIAEKLGISRPAVEKHLKTLKANYFCERGVEPYPSPHYVYFVNDIALDLLNSITNACLTYFQALDGILISELDRLERDFILGRISKDEYLSKKKKLSTKQKELSSMQLTKIWVEEAKRVLDDYNKEKTLK
ncbi:MAG: ArsR/SmtB family transcription factor [Candidatus Hodarchaeales archaeon]